MATRLESSFVVGVEQPDGQCWVMERHTLSDGRTLSHEWLGDPTRAAAVLAARASIIDAQLAEAEATEAFVAGTRIPLTKLQFRELFTAAERELIDEFNDTFAAHPSLTAEQKRMVRTGLKDFNEATFIRVPLDDRVSAMVQLYATLGFITTERAAEVLSG